VIAVDRAPLDEKVLAGQPGIQYIKHDAFTLDPAEFGPLDWVFCDVVCYPPRLYEWVEKLLAAGICKNFVCTIKLQDAPAGSRLPPNHDTVRRFAAIPGSTVVHLCHNKHELTWIKVADAADTG
jgi:23S rRNA (cytidine2498-2'-O)-methyltransferase